MTVRGIQISQKVTYMSFTVDSFLFPGDKLHSPTWRVPGCLLFLVDYLSEITFVFDRYHFLVF